MIGLCYNFWCLYYFGVWILQVIDEGVEVLVIEVEGMKLNFVDVVVVVKDGFIYFIDVLIKYFLDDFVLDNFESRLYGCLFVYNFEDKIFCIL